MVAETITRALKPFDIQEGTELVGFYFANEITRNFEQLITFAQGLEQALLKSVANQKMILLLFAGDVGQMMGIAIRRETAIQSQLMCLDELVLEVGDWIDIGGH